jgi:hypothetical protein
MNVIVKSFDIAFENTPQIVTLEVPTGSQALFAEFRMGKAMVYFLGDVEATPIEITCLVATGDDAAVDVGARVFVGGFTTMYDGYMPRAYLVWV